MKRILLAVLIIAIYGGCSTDFDVIAPYKQVMVVDGLLNAVGDTQYVRISKAFLGEGDAVVMAQQKDSINFGDVLKVKMTESSTGAQFYLNRSERNNKDSGTFAYPFVVLYTTTHHIDQLSKYTLEVTDTTTNNTATSTTNIVGDVIISPPLIDPTDFANFNNLARVTYKPGHGSFAHELRIRFHYREIDPSGNSTYHYVDWNLGTPSSTTTDIQYVFNKMAFYENLNINLTDIQPGYVRRIDTLETGIKAIEYLFVEGSEDLNTYLQLYQTESGVVTDKPLFTTIQNGIGLFSSRLMRSEYRNLNAATITYMTTTPYLAGKGFQF